MNASDHSSPVLTQGVPFGVRALRTIGFGLLFVHPVALLVVAVGVTVLVYMIRHVSHLVATGHALDVSRMCCCGGCMVLLALIALLATGYIIVAIIAGWKASRS